MTAALVYLSPNSVSLLTDGAMMAPDGKTTAQKQKVRIAAHQSAAYVGRGPDLFSGLLAVAVSQVQGGFDDLAKSFAGQAAVAHQNMMAAIRGGTAVPGDPSKVDAVLVGISSTDRAVAYLVSSFPEDGHPAWTMRPLVRESLSVTMRFAPESIQPALVFASPMDRATEAALTLTGSRLWGPTEDVAAHGLAVMRAQRKSKIVGGFCQMTTVTPEGVSSSVLERWL